MKYLTKVLLCIAIIGGGVSIASAEIVDKIVAVVNRKVITQYQVQQTEKQFLAQKTLSSDENPEARREKLLNFLIENELIRQTAEESGILVDDEELNAALADIKKRNNILLDEQLKEVVLRQEGKPWEEFLDGIREQIKIAKFMNREVRARVEITEKEVEQYYESNADRIEQTPATVQIRHILLEVDNNATDSEVQAVRAKAEQFVRELRAGADFAAFARQHSEHPSSETGGELGRFEQGKLAAPFDIAFTMEVGEISEPKRSENGFHIIYVQEKTGGSQATYEKVKPAIRQRLFEEKSNDLYQTWIAELKEQAYIEIK